MGVGVFLVDFTVFLVATELCGLAPLWANPISRTLGALACFAGHRHITFRPRGGWFEDGRLPRHAGRFVLVFLLAMGLSQLYLWLLHHVCGVPAPLAKPVAEGLVFFGNFVLLGRWAFA